MSKFEHKKPRYVREWYLVLKARMKKRKEEMRAAADEILAAEADGKPTESGAPSKALASAITGVLKPGAELKDELLEEDEPPGRGEQSDYDDWLADNIEFSEDEEEDDDDGHLIKNAAQYISPYKSQKKPEVTKKVKLSEKDIKENRAQLILEEKRAERRYYEKMDLHKPAIKKVNKIVTDDKDRIKDFRKKHGQKAPTYDNHDVGIEPAYVQKYKVEYMKLKRTEDYPDA